MPDSLPWVRYRFRVNYEDCSEDYRPVLFPPPGPYWCTGYGDEHFILVAYLPTKFDLLDFWPDAYSIDDEPCESIQFSDRFPRPEWFHA